MVAGSEAEILALKDTIGIMQTQMSMQWVFLPLASFATMSALGFKNEKLDSWRADDNARRNADAAWRADDNARRNADAGRGARGMGRPPSGSLPENPLGSFIGGGREVMRRGVQRDGAPPWTRTSAREVQQILDDGIKTLAGDALERLAPRTRMDQQMAQRMVRQPIARTTQRGAQRPMAASQPYVTAEPSPRSSAALSNAAQMRRKQWINGGGPAPRDRF